VLTRHADAKGNRAPITAARSAKRPAKKQTAGAATRSVRLTLEKSHLRRKYSIVPRRPAELDMLVLVLNCGSSSLRFQLIRTDLKAIEQNSDARIAHGQVERVGGAAVLSFAAEAARPDRSAVPVRDTRAAIDAVFKWLLSARIISNLGEIQAVGHRVVHGGEGFKSSVLITEDVVRGIEDCIDLAPLHNPPNLNGIAACRELLGPDIPQVAVFDTAFHQTLPEHAYLYAIPYQFYHRHRIRRYGFHGTSHRYVAYRFRTIKQIPRERVNIITLHLGNGCSIASIREGNSVDTSMGLTPLEGLVMGTRSGDIDPAIVEYICAKEGLTTHEAETLLNKQSGLLGVSGLTCDMRELIAEAEETGDRRARLAIEIFCYRVTKYIGSYLAAMNGADAIAFTGGIGENSPYIRALICQRLGWLGVELDADLNQIHREGKEGEISSESSRVSVFVIPTNEELLIARDTVRIIEKSEVA
jgi:acetate kinase